MESVKLRLKQRPQRMQNHEQAVAGRGGEKQKVES
jgi:hypothetical protein